MFTLINLLAVSGKLPMGGWQLIPLVILVDIPLFSLAPRLILSMREAYARNDGRGSGIDSEFGLTLPGRGAGETAIVFADVEEIERSEGVEEVRRKSWSIRQELVVHIG